MKSVLGLDIGGANLKAAHSRGAARTQPFALWKNPQGLTAALRALIAGMPNFDLLAVTMTGELCDCFETKEQGVNAILDGVEQLDRNVPIAVWTTLGRFLSVPQARRETSKAAAANSRALATFAGRFAPRGTAILIDVGSTTTDMVPLKDGRPVPRGLSDFDRLRCGELVYTGWKRTPICALVTEKVAAELFATTQDVYLTLGLAAQDEEDRATADGRPATRAYAHARLARMLGLDADLLTPEGVSNLAHSVETAQRLKIVNGVSQVANTAGTAPQTWITSGSGEFLLRRWGLGEGQRVSLGERLGPEISEAACAHAVAVLAAENDELLSHLCVLKVGGSLMEMPRLGERLRHVLRDLKAARGLIVPGGGRAADLVRALDRCHNLGAEAAHWLALRSLTMNAGFLGALLPELAVLEWPAATRHDGWAILEPLSFARADEANAGRLPHTWQATSDSVAARVAVVAAARELVLLKSRDMPAGMSWEEAAGAGIVDPCFPWVLAQAPELTAHVVNFRIDARQARDFAIPPASV